MKIDVFSEIQDPRPWEADHEHRRITQMLEQREALLADPSRGGLEADFLRERAAEGDRPNMAQIVIGRIMEGHDVPPAEVYEAPSGQDSLVVGTPETCRRKLAAFAELGIDRLMSFQQVGRIPTRRS